MRLLITCLLWFNALGCGLLGGVYFAFSTFIMSALGAIEPPTGMVAMNSIDVRIQRSLFMPLFAGTTLASLVLAILGLLRMDEPGAAAMIAAGVLYVAGMFLCTVIWNVPLNNALAAADPKIQAGRQFWTRYLREWTAWNHVRTISSTAASVLYIAALIAQ